MTTQQLPERPDLDQLKRMAKELLGAAQAADPAALRRFRNLPAFGGHSDHELQSASLALHDAQSVVAREHGFPSWNALRLRAVLREWGRTLRFGGRNRARGRPFR